MSGAFVVAGFGAYPRPPVGTDAYAAKLTAEASKFTLVKSELQQGINQILRFITWLLIPVGAGHLACSGTRTTSLAAGRCCGWSARWCRWCRRAWCC